MELVWFKKDGTKDTAVKVGHEDYMAELEREGWTRVKSPGSKKNKKKSKK